MSFKSGFKMLVDNLPTIERRFSDLSNMELLVGVPEEETDREDSQEPTNAFIAYINDNGSPAMNIPARPFMRPGMEMAKSQVLQKMKAGANGALSGVDSAIMKALMESGLICQRSIRTKINEGIPPPLSDATLQHRMENSGSSVAGAAGNELARRDVGNRASMALAKPLINTGQLRNSINFVIKRKGS